MIRRVLSNIIIVLLLGAWGWSAWQAHELRIEVRALQAENRRTHTRQRQDARKQSGTDAGASWVDHANTHLARAEDALKQADTAKAQHELMAGAQDMQRAVRAPIDQTQTNIARAHAQIIQLNAHLALLQAQMRQISAATAPQIGLLRAQATHIQAQAHALWHDRQP